MKANAMTRIIIWSIVLVLLVGLLGTGLYRPGRRTAETAPAATEAPVRVDSIAPTAEEPYLEATVIATAVNVRTAPNSDSTAVEMLEQGEIVTITRQENINGEAWAFITQPCSGWIKEEYLSFVTEAPTVTYQDYSFDPRQIREIDIEWATGSIMIEPADVDTIQASEASVGGSEYSMVCQQYNDKLVIRFSEHNIVDFSFGISLKDVDAKELHIQVPMGWEFETLEVNAASAHVDIRNLTIREVDFDGASGTCNFVNCVISELDIDTASGDIHFTGSLDTLDCDAASASFVAVLDNVPSSIDMDSVSGDLDITLPGNAGFCVTLDSLSSNFSCDFGYGTNKNGEYYRGDGKCRISLNAMSGDLYLREYKEAEAAAETTP